MAAKEPLSALPRTHMGGILTGHGAARCRVRKVWGLLDDCTSVECNQRLCALAVFWTSVRGDDGTAIKSQSSGCASTI